MNGSMMLGAILMFGIILPIAKTHEGDWYPNTSELSSSKDVRGPYAYQVPLPYHLAVGPVMQH